jgi:hypothetical protein
MKAPTPNQIRLAVEPRLVPAQKAARRLHLTEAEFREKLPELLRAGFPTACSITGHYDLKAIDGWLDRRAGIGESASQGASADVIWGRLARRDPKIGLKERLDAVLNKPTSPEPWKPREYADGEWEALVRERPLGLNEKRALSGFYAKRGERASIIFGCGPKTIERLVARGFIKVVGHSNEAFIDTCKITPEGEAAWLAIADREGKDF